MSDKQYKKIQEETDALAQLVTLLTSGIHENRSALENLKLASAQGAHERGDSAADQGDTAQHAV